MSESVRTFRVGIGNTFVATVIATTKHHARQVAYAKYCDKEPNINNYKTLSK